MFKRLTTAGIVVAATTIAIAASASAATYPVSGKQTVINEKAGTSKMTGGLIGNWKIDLVQGARQVADLQGEGHRELQRLPRRRRQRQLRRRPVRHALLHVPLLGASSAPETR